MISQDLLDILRCPLDPSHTRLSLEPTAGGSTNRRLDRVTPGERPPDPGRSEAPAASGTRLAHEGDALFCQRCRLKFAIRDGFPNMVVEEAELPAGCES